MPFIETGIPDLLVFEPAVFEDSRGFFYEAYNQKIFGGAGIETVFVQDNQSRSSYGVIRGLHTSTEVDTEVPTLLPFSPLSREAMPCHAPQCSV